MPAAAGDDRQRLGARMPSAECQARDEVQVRADQVRDCGRSRLHGFGDGLELAAADVDPDETQLGLVGSPTKVKKIENVVFQAKESKRLTAADADIESLMVELIASHTLG